MNLIYSVPNTGTRFAMAFLDFLGIAYLQKHSGEDISQFDKMIVTIRDPVVQFLGFRKRNERRPFHELLETSCNAWSIFTDTLIGKKYITLKIDGVVDFQNPDFSPLQKVANYFDSDQNVDKFGWPIIHAYRDEPTSYRSLNSISINEQELILTALKEHRRTYGYYSDNLD